MTEVGSSTPDAPEGQTESTCPVIIHCWVSFSELCSQIEVGVITVLLPAAALRCLELDSIPDGFVSFVADELYVWDAAPARYHREVV